MDRIKQIASHIAGVGGASSLLHQSPDDIVITLAIRSPLCKAKKGGFKDARTDELMLEMFKRVIEKSKIDPSLVNDICVGNVLSPVAAYEARSAALAAGFPVSTPVQVTNRFCSSGLNAVTHISNAIRAGQIEIGLAVGVESMSYNPDKGGPEPSELMASNVDACDCSRPMGWTSENVAEEFNISREEQDTIAALSFQRAEHAQKSGFFDNEIVPFEVFQQDPHTGERSCAVVTRDDGIRYGTTKESLSKIRPAFPQWKMGTTTGGNASQVSDGAAAILLMKRRTAQELGLEVLAKHITTAIAGVPPRIMGVGPVHAIPAALKSCSLTKEDVDLYEINEAFASQYAYCVKALQLPLEKVNVNGGAIAFGHPLDESLPQIVSGLNELNRREGKVLVTSMCIGTGMAASGVFVRDSR
ncbi:hypothetical protein GYMLUDRAFT_974072 [Collybiopsis luxurians FD-317 M1]|nr:hypothetical protein GYMLUDRAFT_974072 [Collybiopsis luxurians FD-317 M1]